MALLKVLKAKVLEVVNPNKKVLWCKCGVDLTSELTKTASHEIRCPRCGRILERKDEINF